MNLEVPDLPVRAKLSCGGVRHEGWDIKKQMQTGKILSAAAKRNEMADRQSSLLCVPPGLLLLLLAVISSHLPEVHARPTDFWCNCQARKNMENSIEGLKDNRVRNYALLLI